MIDRNELRRLAQAVIGWSNCNKAWRNPDEAGAVVGHINEDDTTYPVMTVDCDLYYSDDSLALAEFYASANPATVLELLDENERLRAEIKRLRAICVKAKDMLLYSDTMYYLDVAGILEDATLGGER